MCLYEIHSKLHFTKSVFRLVSEEMNFVDGGTLHSLHRLPQPRGIACAFLVALFF